MWGKAETSKYLSRQRSVYIPLDGTFRSSVPRRQTLEYRSPGKLLQHRQIFPLLRITCGSIKAGRLGVRGETKGG